MKKRCEWASNVSDLYTQYHDNEWGVPVYDDVKLFEMLILEGAQAGLSWITVLNKREHYRKVFDHFDAVKIARYSDKKIEKLLTDAGIIRNRLKVSATVNNAQCYLKVLEEYEHFSDYIWSFVNGKPVINHWTSLQQVPVSTPLSDAMSKDLKKRGFKFVGSTICYAYMQATGMVNDHTTDCFCYHSSL